MRITRRSSSSSVRPAANDSTNPVSSGTVLLLGLSAPLGCSVVRFRLNAPERFCSRARKPDGCESDVRLRRRAPPRAASRRSAASDSPTTRSCTAARLIPRACSRLIATSCSKCRAPVQRRPPSHRRRPVKQAERRVIANRPQVRHVTHPPARHAIIARASQRRRDSLPQLVDRPETSRRHCS